MTFKNNYFIKLLVAALLCIALYAVLGFFLAPYIVKRVAVQQLSDSYQGDLYIEQLRVNPFALSVEINGLRLAPQAKEPLLNVGRIYINIQASSLIRQAWNINKIEIEKPGLKLALLDDERTNLSWLTDNADKDNGLASFLISQLDINGGQLELSDNRVSPALSTTFDNIDLHVVDIGTQTENAGEYILTLESVAGGQVKLSGVVGLAAKSSTGVMQLSGLSVHEYAGWIPELAAMHVTAKFDLQGSYSVARETVDLQIRIDGARLDLQALEMQPVDALELKLAGVKLTFDATLESAKGLGGVQLRNIATELMDLNVGDRQSGESIMGIDKLGVSDGQLDGALREIKLAVVKLDGGQISVSRNKSGKINWLEYIGEISDKQDGINNAGDQQQHDWNIGIEKAALQGLNVSVNDEVPAMEAMQRISDISLSAANVSNVSGQQARFLLSANVNESGRVEAEGWVVPADASTEMTLTLDGVAVQPFNPYLGEISRLNFDSGSLQVEAKIVRSDDRVSANASASISDLDMSDSVDGERVIASSAITATEISLAAFPLQGTITLVKLVKPYTRIEIDADRRLNISDWFRTGEKAGKDVNAETKATDRLSDFLVNRVEISDAAIDFSDLSLTPGLSIKLDSLQGSIANLNPGSSKGPASLELDGRVGEFGQVNISGELMPFDPTQQSNVKMLLQNMDTTVLSPYSGRFAGRAIKSGKLDLDLDYKLRAGQIKGDNNIVLKDFVLGERVDSADTLDIPLDLAIALLQDKNGRIEISVPVSGDLSNPEFDIRAVIGKAVGNMMTGIVTAPFKALAALFGGKNKQLDTVPFSPGLADITPPAAEVLGSLARALSERPALRLNIIAGFDPPRDRDAIARVTLRRIVMSALGAVVDTNVLPGPLVFADARTQNALEQLADNDPGLAQVREAWAVSESAAVTSAENGAIDKETSYRALFEAMSKNIQVSEDELKSLAESRALRIRDELNSKGIETERLSIISGGAVKKSKDKSVSLALEIQVGQGGR